MKKEENNDDLPQPRTGHRKRISLEGYPRFPAKDDIYNKSQKVDNEIVFGDDIMGDESGIPDTKLDVPGSELDDNREFVGSEDEENNYYSIGGDRHDDLEEDKGE